jgi:hypothetical protein
VSNLQVAFRRQPQMAAMPARLLHLMFEAADSPRKVLKSAINSEMRRVQTRVFASLTAGESQIQLTSRTMENDAHSKRSQHLDAYKYCGV